MRPVVLDADVSSQIIKNRLTGPLATLNHKDFADFTEHDGLVLLPS